MHEQPRETYEVIIMAQSETARFGQGIVNRVLYAEQVFRSAKSARIECLARLRGMNVAFADIGNRLWKEAKVEGYWSTKEELEQAKKEDRQWHHDLSLFIDWVYRTYANYDEPHKKENKTLRTKVKVKKADGERKKFDKTRAAQFIDGDQDKVKALVEALLEQEDAIALMVASLKALGYKVSKRS
jgi:hypothetical protein